MADLKSIVDVTARGGETFVKDAFYKYFDTQRQDLHHLYRESSVLVWNGHAHKGINSIMTFLKSIPASEHTVESIDCHPVPVSVENPGGTILVTVVGTVKYGEIENAKKQVFHESFVLSQDSSNPQSRTYFIANDSFRLVS